MLLVFSLCHFRVKIFSKGLLASNKTGTNRGYCELRQAFRDFRLDQRRHDTRTAGVAGIHA